LGPGGSAAAGLVSGADPARRLASVLRVRAGDPLLLFAGDGREWAASVTEIGRQSVTVTVAQQTRLEPPPAPVVELWVALVRAQRFDWAVEKATEAGADIIRPLVTQFASRGESAGKARRERWQRIAVEASEQCGRVFLPVIEEPAAFDALVANARIPLFIAHPGGLSWHEAAQLLPVSGAMALAIGPEGGFSDDEVRAAKARGGVPISLGPNILRTETASTVAVALMRGAR
jgi:16S rRNA (uracil1498-N3)-methyltransferase